MALVTVQRSPSVAGSPQSTDADSRAANEEENTKTPKSLSECYFAGKGAAVVLGSNEKLRPYQDGHLLRQTDVQSEQSSASGIQQHLQSMFYLLQPEETLKMAVKLESSRNERTRYLVIVSRPGRRSQSPHLCCTQSTSALDEGSSDSSHLSSRLDRSTSASACCCSYRNPRSENTTTQEKCEIASSKSASQTLSAVKSADVKNESDPKLVTTDSHATGRAAKVKSDRRDVAIILDNLYDSSACTCNCVRISQQRGISRFHNNANFSQGQHEALYSNAASFNSEDDCTCDSDNDSGNCSDTEESCLLGVDCNETTTIGLVLKVLADTSIRLDGDGGFSISIYGRTHIFKPVSVQAMWSALQTLHKVSSKARDNNYYPGGPSHSWASYYEERISSERSCLNEWNAMDSIESKRPMSPDALRNKPTKREETECVIRNTLKEIMMSVDLDEVTSKHIRGRLEEQLDVDLGEYKSFLDEEMLVIMGQMDSPTEIFDHVYLGSEWNASNLEELQQNGVRHILNVTREIDNFYPGMFDYFNVRVYDDEKTNLLKHWDNTFKYISRAKKEGSKVLVHCKMGVSRSASVVIAYAMKAYNWNFDHALKHVRDKRSCIKPNKSFLTQLETYQGMLVAMKNKDKLQRSKSETNLKNTKDARLIPGSEPTPLIQALNAAERRNLLHMSGLEMKELGGRPKSWSPEKIEGTLPLQKPQCQSLENITPERNYDRNTNVLVPCRNGKNYSVSQNQVFHLQENQLSQVPSASCEHLLHVDNDGVFISNLYEEHLNCVGDGDHSGNSNNECTEKSYSETVSADEVNGSKACKESSRTETWDPGEKSEQTAPPQAPHQVNIVPNVIINCNPTTTTTITVTNLDKNNCDSPVWTSSAQIVHQTTTSSAPLLTQSPETDLSSRKPKFSATQGTPAEPRLPFHSASQSASTYSAAPIASKIRIKLADPSRHQTASLLEREEQKENRSGTIQHQREAQVSRQSSCSSVDSAVVVGCTGDMRDTPSRHSSWGSGDQRFTPSRNSSFGSYDIRCPSGTTAITTPGKVDDLGQGNEKTEQLSQSGTVKRTKHKIEESSGLIRADDQKTSNNDNISDKTVTFRRECNDFFIHHKRGRCQSEEIYCDRSLVTAHYSRLSASAPETSNIYAGIGESSTFGKKLRNTLSKQYASVDDGPCSIRYKNVNVLSHSGIVRNLKKNFEAKATGVSKKVQSLPSSPVAAHSSSTSIDAVHQSNYVISKTANKLQSSSLEEKHVKGLVGRYESDPTPGPTQTHSNTIPSHSVTSTSSPKQQRPRSFFETKHLCQTQITDFTKPLLISHSTIIPKMDEYRRPPVPPTVRNTICATSVGIGGNSGSRSSMTTKKIQQHGKTHPLAKLPMHHQKRPISSTTAYNTM